MPSSVPSQRDVAKAANRHFFDNHDRVISGELRNKANTLACSGAKSALKSSSITRGLSGGIVLSMHDVEFLFIAMVSKKRKFWAIRISSLN